MKSSFLYSRLSLDISVHKRNTMLGALAYDIEEYNESSWKEREKKINTDFSELSLRQNTNFSALTWRNEAPHICVCLCVCVKFIIRNVSFFFFPFFHSTNGIVNIFYSCGQRWSLEFFQCINFLCIKNL